MSFSSLIQQLNVNARQLNATLASKRSDDVQGFYGALQSLRVVFVSASGYGHQSSTLVAMQRAITLGYSQPISVFYEETDDNGVQKILELLLPGFGAGTEQMQYMGVTLNFETAELGAGPLQLDPVAFALTGGMDPIASISNPAAYFNADAFLVLQPPGWEAKTMGSGTAYNSIWLKDGTNKRLSTVAALGGASFDQFTYNMLDPALTQQDWANLATLFQNNPLKLNSLQCAQAVATYVTNNAPANLMATYGLAQGGKATFPMRTQPYLLCLTSAIVAMQAQQTPSYQKPAVVFLIGDMGSAFWGELISMIHGTFNYAATYGPDDETFAEQSGMDTQNLILQYVQSIGPAAAGISASYCGEGGDTAQQLTTKLNALQNGQILFVNVPDAPPLVFNLLMSLCTFPFIYEGQGTATLALNLGKPFLKMAKFDQGAYSDVIYNLPLMPKIKNGVSSVFSKAIRNLCVQHAGTPINTRVGNLVLIFDAVLSGTGNIVAYFQVLRKLYHSDVFDKLILGTRYYLQITEATAEAPRSIVAAEDGPLQTLYKAILANTSGGNLALCPGAIPANGTPIALFLQGISSPTGNGSLTIANVTTSPPPGTSITVSGATNFFGAIPAPIAVEFTLDADGTTIIAQVTTTDPLLQWSGAPWFSVANASLATTVSDNGLMPLAEISGQITVGGIEVDLTAGLTSSDTFVIAGTFPSVAPSLDSLFQWIGGIDLTALVPSPINQFVEIQLLGFSFSYLLDSNQVGAMTITLQSTPNWQLFGSLTLDVLKFTFTVVDPVGTRDVSWEAFATFSLPPGSLAFSVSYPDYAVTASLADDSPPIPLASIISTFLDGIDVPIGGNLTGFNMVVNPGSVTTYSMSMTVEGDWALPNSESAIFTVTELGFSIDGQSDSANPQNNSVKGSVSGSIEMFASNPAIAFGLTVSATDNGDGDWVLAGKQDSSPIKVSEIIKTYLPTGWWSDTLPEVQVTGLSIVVNTGGTSPSYTVGGTVSVFDIPFIDSVVATAQITNALGSTSKATPSGNVTADINWNGIDLTIGYNYDPKVTSYTLKWNGLTATIAQKEVQGAEHWIASLTFSKSTTLGGMIEQAVTWATGTPFGLAAPWNLLNDISLSDFVLTYDFTDNTVGFSINVGPIDLGFCKIDSIGITYESPSEGGTGVKVVINGSFLWNSGEQANQLSWDATKPETTPAGPGNGNKYFDLRLLAMGQHIDVAGLSSAETVKDAIKAMSVLEPPQAGKLPSVTFDPSVSWLVGLDLGVLKLDAGGYCVTGQIVFDDPNLYGLRLALDGPPAKIFGGLDFQILYRKISDTLGVYSAELTLPTAMRTIQAGIYTIQLPIFGIEVYTNGDFQIDVGFPWNENFARSFTVQAIIFPGIPMLGSGGFYFGKLSSASSNQVPAVTNGMFNPVIVFGFGAQVGFGKSVSYGPLSAAFSLTVLGIIQGVFAKWCPFTSGDTGNSPATQFDGEYFYSITGTFGIAGILSGSIDFAIIKASVNISLLVIAQIVFTSYAPIIITVAVSVDVSASVTINLGIFSISFSFHFSLSIRESFSILSSGTPPWTLAQSGSTGRLDGPLALRHTPTRKAELAMRGMSLPQTVAQQPVWTNLAPAATPIPLNVYLSLALTAAGDEAQSLSQQIPCYVAVAAVDAPVPATSNGPDGSNPQSTVDTSFEALSKLVLRWVIAAFQTQLPPPVTAAQVDGLIVSSDDLDNILAWFSTPGNYVPISVSDIETMLKSQVQATVYGPADAGNLNLQGAFFPMPIELQLSVPAYNGSTAYQYTFGGYNTLSSTAIADLQSYFDQLAIQVQKENQQSESLATATNAPLSVGGFVFADYFLLIARQMIGILRDSLKDFKYSVSSGQTPSDIVGDINQKAGLSGAEQFTVSDLFTANQGLSLTKSKTITVTGASYTVQAADTFTSVAAHPAYGGAFNATQLATANESSTTLLQQGTKVTSGGNSYVVNGGDSLSNVAAGLQVPLSQLLQDPAVLGLPDLLMAYAGLALPDYPQPSTGHTLASIAVANGVTPAILGTSSANQTIVDLFDLSTVTYLDVPHLTQYEVGALIAEAQQTPAINHLSSMVSRFHFHGLRLPTDGITPNAAGMWVSQSMTLPPVAGLFALTGQQFPIPTIAAAAPYQVNIANPSSIPWLTYKNGTGNILISIAATDSANTAITALTAFVQTNRLITNYSELGGEETVAENPGSYSFGSFVPWLSPSLPALAYGAPVAGANQATIWAFPTALESQLDRLTHLVNPAFLPKVQTYDDATGQTSSANVVNYGWATVLEFTIKQVPANPNSPASANTYEIVGVGANDTLLLENVVSQFGDGSSMLANLWIGYAPVGGIGSNGVQSGSSTTVFGMSQVNLSTITNPSGASAEALLAGAVAPNPGALNGNAAFLRLLWEAAITASGGYYLYYSDQGDGLPGTAFNSSGEATLTLVVLYGQEASGPQNQIYDCMNSLVLTDPIPGGSALVGVTTERLETPATQATDTLAGLVGAYYADIGDLAEMNGGLTLTTGLALALNQGVYMVSPLGTAPGGLIASIASYFGMDAQAIIAANPRIPSAEWTSALPAYTAIRLPATTLNIGTSPGGTTLDSISNFYGADLTGLAADNQNLVGPFAIGQTLNINVGPTTRSTNLPPGSQFLGLARPVPPPTPSEPTDPDYAQDLMLNQFSLLGYQVKASQDFTASNLGVPVGPTGKNGTGTGKMRVPLVLSAGDTWSYDVTLAYGALVAGASGSSPYAANGRLLQTDFSWLDLYGNTILSDLSMPEAGDVNPPNQSPVLLGYTDSLIGVGKWPSCTASWTIKPGSPPQVQIPIAFDPSRYIETSQNPSWQGNAQMDLPVYQQLSNQLADPNGIAFTIDTTLVAQPIPVGATDLSGLTGWIGTIVDFLTTQAGGGSGMAPAPLYTIVENVPLQSLITDQIFELACSITMLRPGGIVEGDYAVLSGIRSDSTSLSPSGPGGVGGVAEFADPFEEAFTTAGVNMLKVANGIDRFQGGAATSNTLWAMWVGLEASEGINFSVESGSKTPYIYAPSPISTTLQSRTSVPVWAYTSGQVIDLNNPPTAYQNFSNIDLDDWVRSIFASVDGVLTPEFISSILVVDAPPPPAVSPGYFQKLQNNKEQLAAMYSTQMIPVFTDQVSAPVSTIQEAFAQQMLSLLSNAYSTQAALQYAADVVAEPAIAKETPPNLYGTISQVTTAVNVAFTAVKIPLAKAFGTPLPFLITTPNQTAGFTQSSFITLDLAYAVTDIEHQIGQVPGIDGYLASTWLKPVLPLAGTLGSQGTLSAALGTVQVPMILRSYPATPTLIQQSGVETNPSATDLADLMQWTYSIDYSVPFHYFQDTLTWTVLFNVTATGTELASFNDSFNAMAQFVTVFPSVQQDLVGALAQITAQTTDPNVLKTANAALGSLVAMLDYITGLHQAPSSPPAMTRNAFSARPRSAGLNNGTPYEFSIQESSGAAGGYPNALIVTAMILTSPFDSASAPDFTVQVVSSTPYTPTILSTQGNTIQFYYVDPHGNVLDAQAGQQIPDRTIEVSGLQILDNQNAIASAFVRRNQNLVPQRTTSNSFVYETPTLSFLNLLQPTISTSEPIDIAMIGSTNGKPVVRSLNAHLTALFGAFTQETSRSTLTVQLTCFYQFALNGQIGSSSLNVALPVFTQPPLAITLTGTPPQNGISLTQAIEDLCTAITTWFADAGPSTTGGELAFSLTIMTDQETGSMLMPLLTLQDLELYLTDITPPLVTAPAVSLT